MCGPMASHPPDSLLFDLLNWSYEDIEDFIYVNNMLSKEDCNLSVEL